MYCCAVIDVFSRVVVGWSIADHMRTDLVVDALQMATWRRRPEAGTIVHSDRGSQYTGVSGQRQGSGALDSVTSSRTSGRISTPIPGPSGTRT